MMHRSIGLIALQYEGAKNCDTLLVSDAGKTAPTYWPDNTAVHRSVVAL